MAADSLLSPPPPMLDTPAPPQPAAIPAPSRPGLVRWLGRGLASLPLAIVLLTLLALCIALASFLEASFGHRLAQELVYHTWWFALLLGALAVNVFGAAVKKYPWKRHQAGFLVTHLGLLVLLAGGLLTTVWGVEGEMVLVASPDPVVQQGDRLTQSTDTIQITGRHRLEVFRVPDQPTPDHPVVAALEEVLEGGQEVVGDIEQRLAGHYWRADFVPGSLVWQADAQIQPHYSWAVRQLHSLADPFPVREWPVGEGTLTVHNYYPHADQWPVCPAPEGEPGLAALHVRLYSSVTTRPLDRWIASLPAFDPDPSPVRLELLQLAEPALLSEFLTPPAGLAFGRLGQLVLVVGPQRKLCRVALDGLAPDKPVPLADTGLTLTLKRSGHLLTLLGHQGGVPENGPPFPAVQFELSGPDGKGVYVVCARLPQLPALQSGEDIAAVAGWLHAPELPHVDGQLGTVQFLQGPGRKLYVRSYGLDGLNGAGMELDPSDPERMIDLPWKSMVVQARILTHLPHARQQMTVLPRDFPIGVELPEPLPPAVQATFRLGEHSQDFQVRLGRQAARVRLGNALYFVRYRQATEPLGFRLTLERAEQTSDPGTGRPASLRSEVTLTRPGAGQQIVSRHTLAMNEPLNEGGWKVSQANYEPLTDPRTLELRTDAQGRPLGRCGFSAVRDPGLPWKITGSALVVVGIVVMFTTRASRSPRLAVS
jgi:hypothetical protein